MNKVRITAVRQTVYEDLMAKYENPIEHTCDVRVGQQWVSIDGQQPEGMCPSGQFLRWMDEESNECDDQLQRRLPSIQFLYRSDLIVI